ncbi:MAG: redox-regulated ATPase YchF [Desulfovibrionaceae bacterium]|jgi:GTP-binding protein YchF|nr:redox-regulated ATPase YchF [Desulfovibrionaceae bacterium]
MKTAIIGFAGSGKTDLFAALAGPKAAAVGNRAMVKVPEPRLDPLVALFKPRKVTYSEIEFLDLPGGGGKGGGLGERILNEARPYDCLIAVLDAFSGINDPETQRQSIEADFMVSDLAVLEKRLERIEQDKRKARDLVNPEEEEALRRALALLEAETPLREDPELAEAQVLRGFKFLSAKSVLYAWNCAESDLATFALPEPRPGQAHVAVSARLERELAELTDPEEKAMFLTDLGIEDSALDRVISAAYRLLGLINFLTAGEPEVRSWAVRRGSRAPEAAGAIHSDIQKGFIRAEVLGYEDFLKAGDFKKAKEMGLHRLEGKEYVVRDGDIIEFRFNV